MVDRTALEKRKLGNWLVSSNLTSSAEKIPKGIFAFHGAYETLGCPKARNVIMEPWNLLLQKYVQPT